MGRLGGGHLARGRGAVVVGAAGGGVGELGLAVEEERTLGDDLVALGEAGKHLGGGVADAAELDLAGGVGAVATIHEDHRVPAVLKHGGARHEQGLGRFEGDAGQGGLPVQELAVGVVEDYAGAGRAGRLVEVRVDEGDGRRQNLAGKGGEGDLDGLADAHPCEVGFVDIEDKPHA